MIGEDLSNVTCASSTKHGIRHRMSNRVAVGMADEMPVEWNVNAAELEWSAFGKAMGVVADSDAEGHMT